MIVTLLWFVAGLLAGSATTIFGLPWLLERVPSLARLLAKVPAPAAGFANTDLAARIDAAIAELDAQIRDGLDVERNSTRVAQLREVRG
jgi:hypothetical protein